MLLTVVIIYPILLSIYIWLVDQINIILGIMEVNFKKLFEKLQGSSEKKNERINYVILFGLIIFVISFFSNDELKGTYYHGPSHDNCSFISFSPPNKHHDDYICRTGNYRNGVLNCDTRGEFSLSENSITVFGFYNPNCLFLENRTGSWEITKNGIKSPNGVYFKKW